MDPWKMFGVVAVWMALTAWVVRPVRGKGLPVGRFPLRFYLSGRQGLQVGAFLLGLGVLVALSGIVAGSGALLGAFLAAWLGGLYAFHGRRMTRK
jgi:hypothetical protein